MTWRAPVNRALTHSLRSENDKLKQTKPVSPDINLLSITVHNDLSDGLTKLHAFLLAPNVLSLKESINKIIVNEHE